VTRFLEPACGSGNFLVRFCSTSSAPSKLFGKSAFESGTTPSALMCSYGIELLVDNIAECRANMLEILTGI
jgi:hypothetical protein